MPIGDQAELQDRQADHASARPRPVSFDLAAIAGLVVDPRKWAFPGSFIIAAVAVVFGVVSWADARYAKSDDIQAVLKRIDEARIQDLENRILEIQCAGNMQCRQAIAARYVDQLRALRRSTGNGGA